MILPFLMYVRLWFWLCIWLDHFEVPAISKECNAPSIICKYIWFLGHVLIYFEAEEEGYWLFCNLNLPVLLTILNYVIPQPVPGASNSRATPIDVDSHQGWSNRFTHKTSRFMDKLAFTFYFIECSIIYYLIGRS